MRHSDLEYVLKLACRCRLLEWAAETLGPAVRTVLSTDPFDEIQAAASATLEDEIPADAGVLRALRGCAYPDSIGELQESVAYLCGRATGRAIQLPPTEKVTFMAEIATRALNLGRGAAIPKRQSFATLLTAIADETQRIRATEKEVRSVPEVLESLVEMTDYAGAKIPLPESIFD